MNEQYVYEHCPHCPHFEKVLVDGRGLASAKAAANVGLSFHVFKCPHNPNKGKQRIQLCTHDRGVAGDSIYTLILDPLSEPTIEEEVDFNQPFKTSRVSMIAKDHWETILVAGKTLSEHVEEKMTQIKKPEL